MKRPKPDWTVVKKTYIESSHVSLRDLAKRFSICESTVLKKAHRESWFDEKERLAAQLAARQNIARLEAADKHGREIGISQSSFIHRTLGEMTAFLDKIQKLASSDSVDAAELKVLLDAWRVAIKEGRTAFGLDSQPANVDSRIQFVGVTVMQRVGSDFARQQAKALPTPQNPPGGAAITLPIERTEATEKSL